MACCVNNPGRHRMELYTVEGDLEGFGRNRDGNRQVLWLLQSDKLRPAAGRKYITCEKGLPRVKIYSATGEFESVVAGVEPSPKTPALAARQTARRVDSMPRWIRRDGFTSWTSSPATSA